MTEIVYAKYLNIIQMYINVCCVFMFVDWPEYISLLCWNYERIALVCLLLWLYTSTFYYKLVILFKVERFTQFRRVFLNLCLRLIGDDNNDKTISWVLCGRVINQFGNMGLVLTLVATHWIVLWHGHTSKLYVIFLFLFNITSPNLSCVKPCWCMMRCEKLQLWKETSLKRKGRQSFFWHCKTTINSCWRKRKVLLVKGFTSILAIHPEI